MTRFTFYSSLTHLPWTRKVWQFYNFSVPTSTWLALTIFHKTVKLNFSFLFCMQFSALSVLSLYIFMSQVLLIQDSRLKTNLNHEGIKQTIHSWIQCLESRILGNCFWLFFKNSWIIWNKPIERSYLIYSLFQAIQGWHRYIQISSYHKFQYLWKPHNKCVKRYQKNIHFRIKNPDKLLMFLLKLWLLKCQKTSIDILSLTLTMSKAAPSTNTK